MMYSGLPLKHLRSSGSCVATPTGQETFFHRAQICPRVEQILWRGESSLEELAEKLFVTRQAVSRWENGETLPNTETLKRLSALFDVSINTLLSSPHRNICQCCGMPLEDATTSREPDGSFNEEYCKWCYSGGEFKYDSAEQLINFCVEHMATEAWPAEQVRAHMEAVVPQLKRWKR